MTLDEAIMHAKEKAESLCGECAKEHSQLAKWLTEYKKLKEKQEKYRWHDLEKNPDDTPEVGIQVMVYGWNYHYVFGEYGKFRYGNREYIGFVKAEAWSCNEKLKGVIAWRYIEPFREGDRN